MMFFPYLSLFLFFFSANMNRITQNTHTHTQIAVPCHHILSTIFREQIVLGSFLFRIDLFLFLRILYLTLMMIREGNCSSTKKQNKKTFLCDPPSLIFPDLSCIHQRVFSPHRRQKPKPKNSFLDEFNDERSSKGTK